MIQGINLQLQTATEGKYLTFKLAGEEYGLEILNVKEIIGIMPVTKVPKTPDFVRGVVNLRGKVIPVIELRKKFSLPDIDDTKETCVIFVDIKKGDVPVNIGIIADAVSEVIDIGAAEIEAAPSFGFGIDTSYILGMAKNKNGIKILLNIEKVLTEDEFTRTAALQTTV
jgi:purine-binding chemotaxis protein CheW